MLFKDLVYNALKEGRLQFSEKPKALMQVDADPLKTGDAHYNEHVEILMVEATYGFNINVEKAEQIPAVVDKEMQLMYAQAEEGMTDFLECCKLSDYKTILCPGYSDVFDDEATKKLEDTRMHDPKKSKGGTSSTRFTFDKRGVPRRNEEYRRQF